MELRKTAAEKWLDRVEAGDVEVTIRVQTKRLQDALVELAVTGMAEDFDDLPAEVREQLPVAREAMEALIAGIYQFQNPPKPVTVKPDMEPLGAMSVRELRKEAAAAGVTGSSKMRKDDLIAALEGRA